MIRSLSFGMALLFGIVLAGCGGGNGSSSPTQSVSLILADHLTLTLTEDTTRASVGGAVNYQILLRNQTSAPITSTYQGQNGSIFTYYTGGLNVKDSQGALVNTDGGPAFPLPVTAPVDTTVTLQPGESLTLSVQYTFIRADTYTATATLVPALGAFEQTGAVTVIVH